jgi:DNA-binding IclR family transcriptional regulator
MAQTVDRAIKILDVLSNGPKSLIDLTKYLDTHKSTTLRLLQTLEKSRYARKTDEGLWALGTRFLEIAQDSVDSVEIRKIARTHLVELEQLSGHTIHLAQLIGKELVYVDKIEGSDNVKMYSRIGKTLPIHASAIGKVIYAFLEEPKLTEISNTLIFESFSKSTITDHKNFSNHIKKIQRQEWSIDNGEFEEKMNCIAVPIFNHNGHARMGISISTLKVIANENALREFLPQLKETAKKISISLGFKPSREKAN